MDPNLEAAEDKKDQAENIENTAADIRSRGSTDAAVELETQASLLRQQADQEAAEAQERAEQEKAEVDEKYGTS